MEWKKAGLIAGVTTGVFLGVKYIFPVILPFFLGWILAETVHAPAAHMANKRVSKKLHLSESVIGISFIIVGTLLVIIGVFYILEYLTGKVGECIQYYPEIKEEAENVLWRFCTGIEKITGIPANKSSVYICEQLRAILKCIFSGRSSMNTAVVSVKGCACLIGVLAVCIVSAILFLQERDKIYGFLEKRKIFGNITHILREMAGGVKEYLKAQLKIIFVVCLLCIGGLWILRSRHFIGFGIAIGIFDAFPVLGTGTFLIPAAVISLMQSKTKMGIGLFVLYAVTAGVRQFLEPRWIGNHIGVSPLLVLISVYLGIFLYGGFGFILGPLSAFLIYVILKECHVF